MHQIIRAEQQDITNGKRRHANEIKKSLNQKGTSCYTFQNRDMPKKFKSNQIKNIYSANIHVGEDVLKT